MRFEVIMERMVTQRVTMTVEVENEEELTSLDWWDEDYEESANEWWRDKDVLAEPHLHSYSEIDRKESGE